MRYISPTNTIALIISILGFISAYKAISSRKNISCACMGTYWKLPMTKVTLLENGVMIVMILFMITFPNIAMNMDSMGDDMSGMLMDENTIMSSEMMPTPPGADDAMREHCKMMPEMR